MPYVLIEGDRRGLEFVGHLLLAQAANTRDDGFFIWPKSAGMKLFSSRADMGIYIRRTGVRRTRVSNRRA